MLKFILFCLCLLSMINNIWHMKQIRKEYVFVPKNQITHAFFHYTEVYVLVGNQILWSSKALRVWWSAWTIQFGFLWRLETTFKLLVTECHWASWYGMHSLIPFFDGLGNSWYVWCNQLWVENNCIWFIHPEPIGGEITIAWESSWMDKAPQSDMEKRLMEQLRESKFSKNAPVQSERRGCYYTSIPSSIKHKNVSGDDLTALNLDKVMLLSSIVDPYI